MLSRTVTEIARRDYVKTPYTGNLSNKNGQVDIGGHFKEMMAEVLHLAKGVKAAGILSNQIVLSMSRQVKDALTLKLQGMEATNLPWSNSHIKSMEDLRRNLQEEVKRQNERNAQADVVIDIMLRISARNVQILIEQVQKPFGVDSEEALLEIKRRLEEEFFAEPYLRRRQILELVKDVGLAHTQPEVILLTGILEDIYERTADWIVKTNAEGIKELYDQNTPQVGEGEKLRSLIERMSNDSHALTSYRALVVAGLEEGRSFENVVAEIKRKTRTDIPSLDQVPQRGPDTVLAARVEDARLLAFQAGFQMASDALAGGQTEKRQRTEGVRPYISAPQTSVATPTVQCHYWDGNRCEYEEVTKRECRFRGSHVQGVNTFQKHYVQRLPDMEKYQEWLSQQRNNTGSSSDIMNNFDVNNKRQIYPVSSLSFAAITKLAEQPIMAVSDGGSTGHIMSLDTANELVSCGVIPSVLPILPGTMSVVFGKAEATEPVIGEVVTKWHSRQGPGGQKYSSYINI